MTKFLQSYTRNKNIGPRQLYRVIIIFTIGFQALFGLVAQAQIGGSDIGDIINDIFKSRRQSDPNSQTTSAIDLIPVTINFDARALSSRAPNWRNASLIISAYAPQPTQTNPDNRKTPPVLIGQTRLLIAGLTPPIMMAIAVPGDFVQSIDYARIDAHLVDINDTPLLGLLRSEYYRGEQAVTLNLVPNQTQTQTQQQAHTPAPLNQTAAVNSLSGQVQIIGDQALFRGSKFIVRLIDDGLAGSANQQIYAMQEFDIDQKTGPYPFNLGLKADIDPTSHMLALDGWVQDWAGRKTHHIQSKLAFTGTDHAYTLVMQPTAQPASKVATPERTRQERTRPEETPPEQAAPTPRPSTPSDNIASPPISDTPLNISTRAKFNAHKGLPAGSVLIAELEQASKTGYPNIITGTQISLDGLSGDIDFDLLTRHNDINPNLAKPMIRVRIEDNTGRLFFSNPGGSPLTDGLNLIMLTPSTDY